MKLTWLAPISAVVLALVLGLPAPVGRAGTILAAIGASLAAWGAVIAAQAFYRRITGRERERLFAVLQVIAVLLGCFLGRIAASLYYIVLPQSYVKQLKYGGGLEVFEGAVQEFGRKNKRLPHSLAEIVQAGILPAEGELYSCPLTAGYRSLPYQRCEYELSFSSSVVGISVPRAVFTDERFLCAPEHLLERFVGIPDLSKSHDPSGRDPQWLALKKLVPDAFGSPGCPERVAKDLLLIAALKAPDPLARWGAVEALARDLDACGQATVNFEALLGALDDPDSRVRAAVGQHLGFWLWRVSGNAEAVGQALDRIFPVMISALKDREPVVRVSAAYFLGEAGFRRHGWMNDAPAVFDYSLAEIIVPALERAVADSDATVRASASRAVGRWRADAARSVPVLLAALRDPDAQVRMKAAEGLGEMETTAREAGPALIEALNDRSDLVRWAAADALKTIRHPAGLEAVRRYRLARAEPPSQ